MKSRTRTVAVVGLASLAVAIPATADAKTKSVTIGTTHAQQKALGKTVTNAKTDFVDVNDFFPHGVTIHVGDKVKFVNEGNFHTVDIPAKGQAPLGLVAPTGNIATGNDAAGKPFWWSGNQPEFGFNHALLKPKFGKTVRYNGSKRVESGVPFTKGNFTVKFKKAGKYRYFCDIHPGMTGTVTVRPKSKSIPSSKSDRKRAKRQFKRDLRTAKRIRHTEAPANTVELGAHGAHGVEYYQMFPRTLTVPLGTNITFQMMKGSTEDHTATFAPPADPSYLKPIEQSFGNPSPPAFAIDSRGLYESEAPGTIGSYSRALHGNGFWNSGVLDQSSATPLPPTNSVKFTAPGTYNFYCVIHTNMHGTIHVVAP